ncbi:MAG: AraC family transcriptional activator of pobA [Paracoccaceae bacterium]|jgi:AraC family transcriptional activator of pobA
MPFDPTEQTDIRLLSLGQLMQAGRWQLNLAHDRSEHLLIWITRGQGVCLLDGARRGIGTHNALFIPARQLMAIDPGRQGFGQVLVLPGVSPQTLPQTVQHLRIRDVAAQKDLTMILESLGREQNQQAPLYQSAVDAFSELAIIWLRRQIDQADGQTGGQANGPEPRETAAHRLVRAYCARLVTQFASGASMADHAAALGVTPTHLTRVCRAETGLTAATLLTQRVLHAAHHLLISTQAPVQDIARHLGFGSAAYFTRFMQAHTGQSPTALRRGRANRQPTAAAKSI